MNDCKLVLDIFKGTELSNILNNFTNQNLLEFKNILDKIQYKVKIEMHNRKKIDLEA